ncbi:MAG: hypothetical protein LBL51_04520 [Synergistaceae bacterium]|jgi:hypothetical protein|nr:hypothetical protein [Synergistaceae bacterium]
MCGTDVFDDPSLCSITPRAKKRKGMSITESIILIVVVGITFGALFTVMSWSTKGYAFSKQDNGSRELLFSWIQTFESLWPGTYGVGGVDDAIEAAAKLLGGTCKDGEARIGGFTLTAENAGLSDGILELHVTIRAIDSEKNLVDLTRSYNAFSNETVSDDTVL